MDLNLLAIFDMVMVERHVTRASERLGLTQSAVSNALNRLRYQFGDTLFIKAARGVEPTPRALAIWPDIHEGIAQLNRSVSPGAFQPTAAHIEYRLSMVDLSAAHLTPMLYRYVQTRAPGVTLSFVPHAPELTAERLARGEVDFATTIEPPRMAVLESRPLLSEKYVVAARRGHPALDQPLTLDQLCSLPQLTVNFSGSTTFKSPVDIALLELGRSRRIALSVNQFLVATTMLRESDLLAVMPITLVADAFRQNWLSYQPVPINLPSAVLHLVWHKRSNERPAMLWLRDTIIEAADAMELKVRDERRSLP